MDIVKPMNALTYLRWLLVVVFLLASEVHGQEVRFDGIPPDGDKPFAQVWQDVSEGFDYTVRALAFGTWQAPAESGQNPENEFLKLAHHGIDVELRPDFQLAWDGFDFGLKPRLTYAFQKVDTGSHGPETDEAIEFFINEGWVRLRLHERLLVSYGRENLQWGPSLLSSPTNPFFRDNGRRRLKAEVAGSDFIRSIWVPSEAWSLSLIANIGKGEQVVGSSFKETYALKIDYNGQSAYASLIGSYKKSDRGRLGAYGGWTVSDALLLYGEGMLQQGSEAFYPEADANPFGAALTNARADDGQLQGIGLIGGSYTLAMGPTLTLEYLYQDLGYDREEADLYYQLRQLAAEAWFRTGIEADLARQSLSRTADPELRFLRQNYFMAQMVHSDIKDVLSLTGRWLWNIDDGSSQLYASIVYSWGDHLEIFTLGTYNLGRSDTEFGTFLKYQWAIGLEYVF